MRKLKKLNLQNVYGYRNAEFDFTKDKLHQNLSIFYGQNGCGKTTLLKIVELLSNPWIHQNRDVSMLFRKLVFDEDYNPTVGQDLQLFSGVVKAEALFDTDDGDKRVVLEIDTQILNELNQKKRKDYDKIGIVVNELEKKPIPYGDIFLVDHGPAFFPDADHPMNMQKFQIDSEVADVFLDIAKVVYGYECKLGGEVEEYNTAQNEYLTFYTDFIIFKDFEGTQVHFRSMSAGERKIATLLAMMCNPLNRAAYDIYLIDNLVMHVYYSRHIAMLNKILEHFSEKQILTTTHSGYIIEHLKDTGCLYDVEGIKRNALLEMKE